jgi:hypothetical protein
MNRKILLTVLALTAVLLATPYIGMMHAKQPTSFSFEHWALGYGEPEYDKQAKTGFLMRVAMVL